MSGSVFFVGLVVVILLICTVFVSPFFLIPGVVVAVVAVLAAPTLGAIARYGGRGRSSQVPTTSEASYEPVSQPEDRPV